jgi:hypothetical protein
MRPTNSIAALSSSQSTPASDPQAAEFAAMMVRGSAWMIVFSADGKLFPTELRGQ